MPCELLGWFDEEVGGNGTTINTLEGDFTIVRLDPFIAFVGFKNTGFRFDDGQGKAQVVGICLIQTGDD